MIDREKVANGLRHCLHYNGSCFDCPYDGPNCQNDVLDDAIALLKEQEAVEPILEQDSMVCRICGHEVIWQKMLGDGIWVDEKLDYCPHCGRQVKWNG